MLLITRLSIGSMPNTSRRNISQFISTIFYNGDFALPTMTLSFDEFEQRAISGEGLAQPMRPYSRLLFQKMGPHVISDAYNLATIEPELDRYEFLKQWEQRCIPSPSSPNVISEMQFFAQDSKAASTTGLLG
jgi:hypothetical protein